MDFAIHLTFKEAILGSQGTFVASRIHWCGAELVSIETEISSREANLCSRGACLGSCGAYLASREAVRGSQGTE